MFSVLQGFRPQVTFFAPPTLPLLAGIVGTTVLNISCGIGLFYLPCFPSTEGGSSWTTSDYDASNTVH